MGQDKQQLNHLLNFVKTVYDDPDNKEFAAGIQSMIKKDLQGDKTTWSGKIDEIYEYCLKKNLREQAEELYKNFPLEDIKVTLIEDFIKMEESRRRNDFDEFGVHLYQQIENIVNTLSQDSNLSFVVSKMFSEPAFIENSREELVNGEIITVYKKESEYSPADRKVKSQPIADFVLGIPWNDGTPNGVAEATKQLEKKKVTPLSNQKSMDKLFLILYFVGYNTMLCSNNFSSWKKNKATLRSIYNVRNHVHRGGQPYESQIQDYQTAIKNKSFSYIRFLSALVYFIDSVEKGFPISEELMRYAASI